MRVVLCTVIALVLGFAKPSQASEEFSSIMGNEVEEATKLFFVKNPNLDDDGFNTIDLEQDWEITDLFKQYYGETASTARYVAATLDFTYLRQNNVTFNTVYQLIIAGEHQDARSAMAAYSFNLVRDTEGTVVENVGTAKLNIRSKFESLCSLVGDDRFASFLNLRLGSSLSFVMDTTGSMGGEIEAAKQRVVDIVDHTAGTNNAPLNYVLVPYNDPGFGPVTKTSNSEEFIDAVDSLTASGGGDSPELAMIGILLAVQNSNFRSTVYVFTDASAKDSDYQNHVIALCLIKKISVNVFLTTDISRRKRALLQGRALYDNVAELSGGSVIYVPKSFIQSGTEIMKASTVQGMVNLLYLIRTSNSTLTVYVDSTISSLTVQFTGTFSYMSYSSDAENDGTINTLAEFPNVKLFSLEGVSPGTYSFNFNPSTDNEYTAQIRGKSGLGFHARLSQKRRGTDTFVASRQLLARASTIADVNTYGDADKVSFQKFQLVSQSGQILLEKSLSETDSITRYSVEEEFDLPEEPMFVRATGIYDGQPIERTDPCAITPTVSESYFDDIADVTVTAGDTIQVTTVLHNKGPTDNFILQVSDIREFVSINGAGASLPLLTFDLAADGTRTITLDIEVPSGTQSGVLSKVLLTATGVTDNYFVFIDFIVHVEDDVIRCPTPTNPIGGELLCNPDARSIDSTCKLNCGDEYMLEGGGQMTCQSDGTWSPEIPGTCRFLGSQTCSLGGDPHYTTFDGFYYDFMGSCLYTLVETKVGSDIESVTIRTENDLFYGRNQVSWLKQAFVTVYNTTVHLKRNKIVLIDGIRVELPLIRNRGDLRIQLSGGDVVLTTGFKLEVRFNGNHYFRVTLPGKYISKVSGLCGNYDGDDSNEFMIGNETYTAASSFGNAFEIVGGSNPWCRKGQPDDDDAGCENEAVEALYAEKCNAILSDCFQGCSDNRTAKEAFNGCLYDMCKFDGNQETAEGAIQDYATSCQMRGIQICNWRERFDYPLPACGVNEHYEFQANPCPNTCVNREASERCRSQPKSAACVCNDGFVRDGTDCVRASECGCAQQGQYFKKGFSFLQDDCTRRCECQNGKITCTDYSCEEGTECRTLNTGRLGCQQQQINQFCATGDPHYKTLDGTRYDFMGTCRYIMMKTKSDMVSDSDRLITISAQNENRGGNTRVSYIQSVYVEIGDYLVKIGPGTEIMVWRNGTELEVGRQFQSERQLFSIAFLGSITRLATKFGVVAKFDGTDLHVDVPSYYMGRVYGMGAANYTGFDGDDLGGMSVDDFAASHIYGDGCEEEDREPFVCSDEDKAKWGGADYCGKITDPEGLFQYCIAEVDPDGAFQNCVFDACATDGEAVNKAIEAFAQECRDKDAPLQCEWPSLLGIAPDCPENSRYDWCGSVCMNTCQNTRAEERCESDDLIGRCVCDLGYIMNDGKCVKQSTCGCIFEDGTYHEQGYMQMAENCTVSTTCVGAQAFDIEENPCGEFATCQEQDGEFECVPKELPYALIYGAINFKTFDNRHSSFGGNCGYLVAGYISNDGMSSMPSWNVYITNAEDNNGRVRVDEVVVEVWMSAEIKNTLKINREKEVTINGIRARFGTKSERVEVSYKRGDAVLDFPFGLHVRFNGDDWIRIDVTNDYREKLFGLAGNFNDDPSDDFRIDGMTYKDGRTWGDFWYRNRFSSDKCRSESDIKDMVCPLQQRFERSCDCGVLEDADGPFSACHEMIDPKPFMQSCIRDACLLDGSVYAISRVLRAYYRACIGKGILIENWRDVVGIRMECPMNSHYESCASECQSTCGNLEARCPTLVCQEGCVCDDGYVLSNGECIEMEKCGCIDESSGFYYEHGDCVTKMNCTEKCTCIYGEWNCEDHFCNSMQSCKEMNGELGCYWKDPCKYDNGGCSDMCEHDDDFKTVCSCKSRRILSSDNVTCIDIAPHFFGTSGDSCGTTFNIWKAEFRTWQNNYLPQWQKELEAYRMYMKSGILSTDLDICQFRWTEYYNGDDPGGCGDEETLDLLRVKYPEICKKPIWAEAKQMNERMLGSAMAKFQVDANGVVCKNADQEKGVSCPDFSVRFLCRIPAETNKNTCG